MKCNNCGKEYNNDFNYCPYCGVIREKDNACPNCGNIYNKKDKFCLKCGNKLKKEDNISDIAIFNKYEAIAILCILGCAIIFLCYGFRDNDKDTKNYYNSNITEKNTVETTKKESTRCSQYGLTVSSYQKHKYYIDVILINNNDCSWSIKSYTKVRVYFSDGSYEDVNLGTNINLASKKSYTFEDCYIGSKNENKTVKSVLFLG